MTLYLPIGIPGSGKSTFGAKHFLPTEIVNADHYRGVLTDDESNQSASQKAFDLCKQITSYRLLGGRHVYYDATNLKEKFWPSREGHLLVAIIMDCDYDTAWWRNTMRERQVPREAFDRMAHMFPSLLTADFVVGSNDFNRENYE